MTTFLTRSVLVLGAIALPFAAQAEDRVNTPASSAETTIVVSAEHQRDWDRGNRLEAEGLADLAKAERDLVRYSADVVTSQNSRDTNEAQAENARRTFEAQLTQSEFANGKEARRWADRLEGVAKDWEQHSDRMEDASKDLDRALRRQADAQEEVEKAQAKVDRGRAMMRSAEAASQAS